MKKLLTLSVLALALVGLVGEAAAQQPQGRSFGSRVCAENMFCDAKYNSSSLESLIAIAYQCARDGLNMHNMPSDYFDASAGLDESNCISTNMPSERTPGMYAKCCFFEAQDDSNSCKLLCSKVSVR